MRIMPLAFKKISPLFLFYACVIVYLLINTGLISDDFDAMLPSDKLYFISTPVQYLTHYVWYPLFSLKSQLWLNFLKIAYITASFYFSGKFFSCFFDKKNSLLAAFLFIFYPSHDASVYSFICQYLTLSFGFYLYAFYLARKGILAAAFLFGMSASFISYGSTPLAIALSFFFALERDFKKAAVLFLPNLIYAAYFIFTNIFLGLGIPRVMGKLSFACFLKQYALQVLSFSDALFGPSLWLKIYYSFWQLGAFAAIAACITLIFIYKFTPAYNLAVKQRIDKKLLVSLCLLVLLSFFIFALTGGYPQMAFNLGNRVTIYGSLLAAYLLIALIKGRARFVVLAVLIFSIFGISSHWKQWSLRQGRIINNIAENPDLRKYNKGDVIYACGSQYSRFGPFSHIEFFSEDWVVNPVFQLALGRNMRAACLNKRHKFKDGFLFDAKYGSSVPVGSYINVYDCEKDVLFGLEAAKINDFIATMPLERRHWIQAAAPNFFSKTAEKLMPRLKYALE